MNCLTNSVSKRTSRVLPAVAAAVVAAGLCSCSSKPAPATGADAVPAPTSVSAAGEPTPVPVPPEPPVTVVPQGNRSSGKVDDALRGYLKDVFFEYDKAEIRSSDRETLSRNADFLNRREFLALRVLVEGHCDERGTAAYNMALGEKRASTIRDFLGSLGVDPGRIQTISYGKERPFVPGHDDAAWSQNRRAHFVVVGR